MFSPAKETHFSLTIDGLEHDLQVLEFTGRCSDRTRGKHLSKRALERHRADYRLAEGQSDQPQLVTGHLLEISDHPRTEWNDLWLLTEVPHEGKQPQVLEESVLNLPSPSGRGAGGDAARNAYGQYHEKMVATGKQARIPERVISRK